MGKLTMTDGSTRETLDGFLWYDPTVPVDPNSRFHEDVLMDVKFCDQYAEYYSAFTKAIGQNEVDRNEITIETTLGIMRVLFPRTRYANGTWSVTDGEYLDKYGWMLDDWFANREIRPTAVEVSMDYTMENCTPQFCEPFRYQGDSDLTGVGMIVIYYIAAAFAALACVTGWVRLWNHFMQLSDAKKGSDLDEDDPAAYRNKEKDDNKKKRRTLSGMTQHIRRKSSIEIPHFGFHDLFVVTALGFALAMVICGVIRFSKVAAQPHRQDRYESMLTTALMPTFCTMVAMIGQIAVGFEKEHRKLPRLIGWAAIVVANFILAVMAFVMARSSEAYVLRVDYKTSDSLIEVYSEWCDIQLGNFWKFTLRKLLNVTSIFLLISLADLLYCALVVSWILKKQADRGNRLATRWRELHKRYHIWAEMLISTFALGMCLAIALMFVVHDRTWTDDESWTFGQIMALATWAPVFYYAIVGFIDKFHRRKEIVRRMTTRRRRAGTNPPDQETQEYHMVSKNMGDQEYDGMAPKTTDIQVAPYHSAASTPGVQWVGAPMMGDGTTPLMADGQTPLFYPSPLYDPSQYNFPVTFPPNIIPQNSFPPNYFPPNNFPQNGSPPNVSPHQR